MVALQPAHFFPKFLLRLWLRDHTSQDIMTAFKALDELLHLWVRNLLNLLRTSLKKNLACFQHGNALGDIEYVRYLMADHHRCEPELFLVVRYHVVHSVLANRIQSGSRFIKQDRLGIGYQGP